jgi:hypothetical protein
MAGRIPPPSFPARCEDHEVAREVEDGHLLAEPGHAEQEPTSDHSPTVGPARESGQQEQ